MRGNDDGSCDDLALLKREAHDVLERKGDDLLIKVEHYKLERSCEGHNQKSIGLKEVVLEGISVLAWGGKTLKIMPFDTINF